MTILLDALLRDSAYQLDQFSQAQIDALQAAITTKATAKGPVVYANCVVRGKPLGPMGPGAIQCL